MEKILVVDDDESFLDFLKIVLNKNFDVTTAKSYREAMDIISKETFKAVVLDLSLPKETFKAIILDVSLMEYSGYYLSEQIRKIDANVPIAFLTNYDSEVTRENAASVNASVWQKGSVAAEPESLIGNVKTLIYG